MLLSFDSFAPHDMHVLFTFDISTGKSKCIAQCVILLYSDTCKQILNDHPRSNHIFIAKSVNYTLKVSAVYDYAF